MVQQVALVTGASSGIGRATTQLLAAKGYYVFAGARRLGRLEELRSDNIEPIELDVTNDDRIRRLVDHVISSRGRIDVLVNNAGFGQLGTVECVSMEAAHRQLEVNVFGYARFMQAVLPQMRKQKSGHIVNITSVMGRIATPGFGWYAASKHAVEALTDAVRGEVMEFGIKVVLIAPGLIKTEFVTKQLELLKTVSHPPAYHKILKGLDYLLASEPTSPGPGIIAQAVLDSVTDSNPPVRHALPLDSKLSVAARWLFGARLFARVVRHQMKLKF